MTSNHYSGDSKTLPFSNISASSPVSLVEYKHARFLITDAPTDKNFNNYLEEFKRYNVRVLVRTCDPSYSTTAAVQAGIEVHELGFPDGRPPPDQIVSEWLGIVAKTFSGKVPKDGPTIAIHCVAGLGRAPVLVAVALIELGMDRLDAITYIRQRRPKAFNLTQINYLEHYQRKQKGNCVVM